MHYVCSMFYTVCTTKYLSTVQVLTKTSPINSILDNFVKFFTLKFNVRNIHAPFISNLKYFEWNKTQLNFKHKIIGCRASSEPYGL